MDIIGIIAEFDPFHKGHAHLISQARRLVPGAPVVCVMSGYFTQRGAAAIVSSKARAEMALGCGADLVVELPVQWASASAEQFARGGVRILQALGVTHLVFGSEVGTISPLRQAADVLDAPELTGLLRPYLQAGISFAAARQKALEALTGTEAVSVLQRPNNLLGIEYLRAIRYWKAEMEPLTTVRVGAAHNDTGEAEGFLSGAQLRQWLLEGALETVCAGMPAAAARVLREEWDAGRCPAALHYNGRGLLTRLRMLEPEDYRCLPDCGEGLEHRLYRAGQQCWSLEECYDQVKSKRYAHARVRRLILWAYLGLTAEERWTEGPCYLRVLGLGENGRKILRRGKELGLLPVLGKAGSVRRMSAVCQRQFALERRVEALWILCLEQPEKVARGGET